MTLEEQELTYQEYKVARKRMKQQIIFQEQQVAHHKATLKALEVKLQELDNTYENHLYNLTREISTQQRLEIQAAQRAYQLDKDKLKERIQKAKVDSLYKRLMNEIAT